MSTYYTKEGLWIKVNGSEATVGITERGQKELGDVVFVDIPKESSKVSKGEECGALESVKTVESLFSPVSGKVVKQNAVLLEKPDTINASPCRDGWLFTVELSDVSELKGYMDENTYMNSVK